jgi:hypothetical protein
MAKLYRYLNAFGDPITKWFDNKADAWRAVCEQDGPDALELEDMYTPQTVESKEEAMKLAEDKLN